MLFSALTPIRLPLRSVTFLTGEPDRVYRAWVPGYISEPSAMISRLDWPVTWSWM